MWFVRPWRGRNISLLFFRLNKDKSIKWPQCLTWKLKFLRTFALVVPSASYVLPRSIQVWLCLDQFPTPLNDSSWNSTHPHASCTIHHISHNSFIEHCIKKWKQIYCTIQLFHYPKYIPKRNYVNIQKRYLHTHVYYDTFTIAKI